MEQEAAAQRPGRLFVTATRGEGGATLGVLPRGRGSSRRRQPSRPGGLALARCRHARGTAAAGRWRRATNARRGGEETRGLHPRPVGTAVSPTLSCGRKWRPRGGPGAVSTL